MSCNWTALVSFHSIMKCLMGWTLKCRSRWVTDVAFAVWFHYRSAWSLCNELYSMRCLVCGNYGVWLAGYWWHWMNETLIARTITLKLHDQGFDRDGTGFWMQQVSSCRDWTSDCWISSTDMYTLDFRCYVHSVQLLKVWGY